MNNQINTDDTSKQNNADITRSPKEYALKHFAHIKLIALTLLKWLLCALMSGFVIGAVGALFAMGLNYVTSFRADNSWILFLLPLGGIIIVALYRLAGVHQSKGTNLVINAIHSKEKVPVYIAPLIILSTIITHLFGGSAGREGAALQIGGSVGNAFAKLLRFDEKDTKILIMCGMSACFSALFGTPVAAAIFSMEVISVGVMYYAALVPCVLSAIIANEVSFGFGVHHSEYILGEIPELSMITGSKIVILGIIFALGSILFCVGLHAISDLFNKIFTNSYIKIAAAGILIIALRYIVGTTDYLGAGSDIIVQSFLTSCAWYVFLLKIIFTAITLGGGYKGGEIVPALFVGATLGSFLAPIFGLPIGLCAACGMVSIFCGATNCPLTSLLLAIEMFGTDSIKYYIITIAISYLLSGYYSLYHSQRIVYSKYTTTYINRNSN